MSESSRIVPKQDADARLRSKTPTHDSEARRRRTTLKQIETSEQATRGLKVSKLNQALSETGLACLMLLVSGEARRLLKCLTLGRV
jgi:hypothetical protein